MAITTNDKVMNKGKVENELIKSEHIAINTAIKQDPFRIRCSNEKVSGSPAIENFGFSI